MKCDEVMELMQRQLDEELNQDESDLVAHHLSICPECQELHQKLHSLSAQLVSLPKVELPYSIVDRIMPDLQQEQEPGSAHVHEGKKDSQIVVSSAKRRNRWWISGSVIAAGLIFAILMIKPDILFPADEQTPLNITLQAPDNELGAAIENEEMGTFGAAEEAAIPESDARAGDPASGPELESKENSSELTVQQRENGEEVVMYLSPDGVFSAYVGLGEEDIRIDKEGEPYYISKHTWERTWTVTSLQWRTEKELLYVLENSETGELEYWLIQTEERTETELEDADSSLESEG